MYGNWKNWCRLCAKCDCKDVDDIGIVKSIDAQLEIVNKNFDLSLSSFEGLLISVCEECSGFVSKLNLFRERCFQAENMFQELLRRKSVSDADLKALRLQYNFQDDFPHEPQIGITKRSDPLDIETNKSKKSDQETPLKTRKQEQLKKRSTLPRKSPRNTRNRLKLSYNLSPEEDKVPEVFVEDGILGEICEEDDIPLKKRIKCPKDTNQKIQSCSICSKSYKSKDQLTEHMRERHSDEELPFSCCQCHKRFINKKKLKSHSVKHLPDAQKFIHPCPFCDKKFSTPGQIQIHVRVIHEGDKPFICEECGKSFGTKGGLTAHQITHSDDFTIQCPHCPKKFKSNKRLKRHIDVHNETKYTCPHCGILLKTQITLKMHLLVHSDVKKYKCHYCGNEYKYAKSLKNHLILHTGLRPYSCPFCDKTFANGSNCRSHKKKAHPVELAALEASGEVQQVTNIPKLEQLQPKS
ncbi:hypothetical protein DMENIID0001_121500 [Sergentomyia squamirostris]